MYRYLVFSSRGGEDLPESDIAEIMDRLGARSAATWHNRYTDRTISIWDTGDPSGAFRTSLFEPGVFILGRVISRSGGYPEWRARSICDVSGVSGLRAQARWLFENIWGAYVAIECNPVDHSLSLLRDPSGGLPCHHTRWKNMDVFSSNADLFRTFPGQTFTVDFGSVAAAALLPNICKSSTGILEIGTVLPGELSTFGADRERQYMWNPVQLAGDRLVIGRSEAAAMLRETLIGVTGALARPYAKILHNLGGLDSSILLACLQASRPGDALTCVTHFSDSLRGDERHYTRAMAAHSGAELIETRLDPARVDLPSLDRQELGASPSSVFDCLQMAGNLHGIAAERDVDAFTYGFGGDIVLYNMPGVYPALDYVAQKQPFARLPRILLDAAQCSGWSMRETVFRLFSEMAAPADCTCYVLNLIPPMPRMPFLNPDVAKLDDAIARIHPTLVAPADFPKGKYLQIATSAYLNIDYHLSVQGQREIDRLCPLLAQPFLELCYRLPTWQQIDGGIDRSLARSAFRDLLPDHIVGRVSKSVPEGIYDQVFIRNRDMISARLMDGRLVSNAIVNRTYLEDALHSADALSVSSLSTILQLYDWEIWADRWSAS